MDADTQAHPSDDHSAGWDSHPYGLYDLHCHLDFAPSPAFPSTGCSPIAGAFSCTVTPRGYVDYTDGPGNPEARLEQADRTRSGCAYAHAAPQVRIGVGLHPWWLADGACGESDIALLEDLITGRFDGRERRFVGEVGLDFAPRRTASVDAQTRAFDRIVAACADGGRVISIHAVRSAGAVLDILEKHRTAGANACILHWFSGSGEELGRAVRMGCYFSLGTRMLATKRGRAYARAIPPERLLLETDLPDGPEIPLDIALWVSDLSRALRLLEEAVGHPVGDAVARNSARLLEVSV